MKQRGFTLLELMLAMVVLGVLAAAVFPTTRHMVKRQKEVELRRALLEMRLAIDRFKKAHDEGLIEVREVRQFGYPKDFEQLVEGVPLKKDQGQTIRFLRRIPEDPMTGEREWGMRSVQDDPDTQSWGRENLFDVYSLSDGVSLEDEDYSEW